MDFHPLEDPTGQPWGQPTAKDLNLWKFRHGGDRTGAPGFRHPRPLSGSSPAKGFPTKIPALAFEVHGPHRFLL